MKYSLLIWWESSLLGVVEWVHFVSHPETCLCKVKDFWLPQPFPAANIIRRKNKRKSSFDSHMSPTAFRRDPIFWSNLRYHSLVVTAFCFPKIRSCRKCHGHEVFSLEFCCLLYLVYFLFEHSLEFLKDLAWMNIGDRKHESRSNIGVQQWRTFGQPW